ncbi:MAG: DUF2851 family protein [Saonia sp.]
MQEDLLHFIWKYKRLQLKDLATSKNEAISIVDIGTHNQLAGPDFFNAKVKINDQLWAGNVEIHLKSSDWYTHHHEKDANYNNIILHVVWEDDVSVFRKDNTEVPALELKNYISKNVLEAYQKLFDKKDIRFINCERDIKNVDSFLIQNWLERLYFERLERKSVLVMELLEQSKNDWEKVLFVLLLKNFGSKINGDAFLSIGRALDFSVVRKVSNNDLQLESILFGLAGFLNDGTLVDEYYGQLKNEYAYVQKKFGFNSDEVLKPEFFKLRPSNFPTIRLSQLAKLYEQRQGLFSKLIKANSLAEIYTIFEVSASSYWTDHFTFGKVSGKSNKKLTKKFIDLLVINTILPLKFCYAKYEGTTINEEIVQIITGLKKEENSIVDNFKLHGIQVSNAMESQSILQLYNEYCTKNKCLQCAVGNSLLNRNS